MGGDVGRRAWEEVGRRGGNPSRIEGEVAIVDVSQFSRPLLAFTESVQLKEDLHVEAARAARQ